MNAVKIPMSRDKKIALVAHDNTNRGLPEWATSNSDVLTHHVVYATGTTGSILERQLGFPIRKLQSGPLGGDRQIGSRIVSKGIDVLGPAGTVAARSGRRRLASVAVAESSARILRNDPKTG